MSKVRASIGVIGGSGLYALDDLVVLDEVRPKTPFGRPSDKIVIGQVSGHNVAFLPRHGRGHRLLPTEVPSKANIAAFKSLGVEKIISFSAVGSLKEKLAPLDFCIPNQVIDRTRLRDNTFFGDGVVGHVAFADPFSKPLNEILYRHARKLDFTVHRDETLVCMEGPAFSSRAESHLYRSWNGGLINMSALPEAKLAREAEISYGLVCMVTDYDCWREEDDDVDIQMVINNLNKNAANAQKLLRAVVPDVAAMQDESGPRTAAKFAIITQRDLIPKKTLKGLRFLYPDYFGKKKGAMTEAAPKKKGAKESTPKKATKKKAAAKKPTKKKATKKKVTSAQKTPTTKKKRVAKKPSSARVATSKKPSTARTAKKKTNARRR